MSSPEDPFRDMSMLQERMNRLFEDSLARSRTAEEEFPMGSWMPAVDVYETDARVVIRVDLPGVDQSDIDLRIEDGALVLRGERKFASGEKQEDFLRIERSYGSFQRTFRLPGTVDPGQVQASHKDGVLEILLQKKGHSAPQAVKIEVT
jgi:HSP20 family protein